jgi:sugar/nucleoside kinase (ribokinase family)
MKETTFDVLGIGNALVDVLARAEDEFLASNNLEKGAMTLVNEHEAKALYGKIGPAVEVSGGSAANTIAGVASFGGRASYIGKVAGDSLGDIFAHDITAAGVTFDCPRADAGHTGHCTILVTPDAQRTMNTFLGASSGLSGDDVDETQVASAGIVYLEGYLFDPAPAKEAFYKAAKAAHKAKRTVALTLSDSFCVERYRDEFKTLVESEIDLLFANEAEIMALYETDTFDDALQIVREKCSVAALTRSEAGSVIVRGDDVHVIAADKVAKVVDSTGAGDLYAAGFLYGYATGHDLKTCGQLASLAAGEVIGHFGARPEKNLAQLAKEKGLLG